MVEIKFTREILIDWLVCFVVMLIILTCVVTLVSPWYYRKFQEPKIKNTIMKMVNEECLNDLPHN